jgi:AcrR family transcriptional regulator
VSPATVKRLRPRKKKIDSFHHGDLREALILAAQAAVARDGHMAMTLRPLAVRLGVSQPAVYRHFGSREALLMAVAERVAGLLAADILTARDAKRDPFAKLRAAGRAYVDWAYRHPNWFRLLSSRIPADTRSKPIDPLPDSYFHAAMGGIVPLSDPRLRDAYRACWAVAHGLATFVVERVFQLVESDEERLAAAYAALDCQIELLRSKWPDG